MNYAWKFKADPNLNTKARIICKSLGLIPRDYLWDEAALYASKNGCVRGYVVAKCAENTPRKEYFALTVPTDGSRLYEIEHAVCRADSQCSCNAENRTPPDEWCTCGFYFFYEKNDAENAKNHENGLTCVVFAEFFGRIILAEYGGRAQYRRLLYETS